MEHIYYIVEDINTDLSKYSDAQLLPGSIKNVYNNEKSLSYSNTHAASNMNDQDNLGNLFTEGSSIWVHCSNVA